MIKAKPLVSAVDRPKPDDTERSHLMRLDKNERTTLFTESEFRGIMSTITVFDLVAYSELEPTYKAFAKWLGIGRENILLTCGSDAGIKSIYETFIQEGDEIINFDPNYAMFSVYAKLFGAREVVMQYQSDFTINIPALLNTISEKTKMVIISNPGHNGVSMPSEDILKVIDTAAKFNTLVVVDEAYFHFSEVTLLPYIYAKKNMIIVRTLSKAFGLASIRVGYLVGCAELISELYRVKLVHEIDGLSSKIARYMIEHPDIMENYVAEVSKGHCYLRQCFGEMGIKLMPSNANFVYFNLNKPIASAIIIEELKKKNIHIRTPIKTPPFNDYLRITLGSSEQMAEFCATLKEILNKYHC
jgi:histidinol-phosphate aminotransferase